MASKPTTKTETKIEKRQATLAKQTAAKKQQLLECLAIMPTVESACRKAGVGRATYYDWISDNKFEQAATRAKKKGRQLLSDVAVSKLMQLVSDGNITAIIFWLRHNHEWFANPKFFHHIEVVQDTGVDPATKELIYQAIGKYVGKVKRDIELGATKQSLDPR